MSKRLALIPAFLFLFGCPPEDIEVRPVPVPDARALRLDPGNYVLSIENVHEVTCDVVDPREVEGVRMAFHARFSGPKAMVDLEGLPMEGWMKDGVVRAFGSFDEVMADSDSQVDHADAPPEEPREDEADAPPTADDDSADEEEAYGEDKAEASADAEGEDSAGSPPADRDDRPDEAAPIHGQVELILDLDDAQHARGALNITYSEGCHLGLDVRIVPSEDKPVPVEEEEPPSESEPCGDEEDCG